MIVRSEKYLDRDQAVGTDSSGWADGVNLTKEGTSKLRLEHGIRIHSPAIVVPMRAFQAEGSP